MDQAPVLGLVLRDDGEVVVVKQRTALGGFAFAQVVRASLPDDVAGHEQSDCPVGRSAAPGDLRVRVLRLDL
ncbi:hypothetical protein, partial [Salinispora arenicola]|uniref:hypothetical protein n=1 Tax=Salinispora arenicola TaxID=168697 RepID=UPI001E2F9158